MVRSIILKNGILLSALIFVLYTLIFPIPAYTETFNVTNEDELREALSIAEANGEDDTINVAAGLYRTFGETFTFESSEEFSLTIEGEGAGITILDGEGLSRVLSIEFVGESFEPGQIIVTVKGITIQNGNNLSEDFPDNNGGGLFINRAESVTIEQCNFVDNTAVNGSGGGAWIRVHDLYLYDNEFYGNMSGYDGAGLKGDANTSVVVVNNIFAQNFLPDLPVGQRGVAAVIGTSENASIINNTITFNSAKSGTDTLVIDIPWIQDDDVGDHVFNIYNNIVIGNNILDGADIKLSLEGYPVPTNPPTGFPTPVTVNYGTVNSFNNDIGVFEVEMFLCDVVNCILQINEGNNISEDPLFIDAASGDFGLMPDSPCIDAGDPNAPDVPDTDIFGNPRVPPPDMGAVEYIVEAANNGGCSLSGSPATSSLAAFITIPVLILIRRIIKITRRS